jgi:dihydrofolate reductase
VSKLRVHAFAVSVDGYGAGADQSLETPLGRGAAGLHEWMFATRTMHAILGRPGGETGIDEDFTARGFANVGAWIMGRNMFGPIRGRWPDERWRGWWGENPPFHTPVFVLTQHPRARLQMAGDNVFHFITDGIHSALQQARHAANGKDIRLGGGVATLRQYLNARLVDEMHVAIAPVLLGRGEALFAGMDLPALGYRCIRQVPGDKVTHLVITRD